MFYIAMWPCLQNCISMNVRGRLFLTSECDCEAQMSVKSSDLPACKDYKLGLNNSPFGISFCRRIVDKSEETVMHFGPPKPANETFSFKIRSLGFQSLSNSLL